MAWSNIDVSKSSLYQTISLNYSRFSSCVSPDGTKYAEGEDGTIRICNLSTPYDINTRTSCSNKTVPTLGTPTYSLRFSNDNNYIFASGWNRTIYKYNVSDGSSAGSKELTEFGASEQISFSFSKNGEKLYARRNNTIRQYSLSTAFNLSTVSYDSKTLNLGFSSATTTGIFLDNDGYNFIAIDYSNTRTIVQYNLSTAYDITTASETNNFYVGSNYITSDICFSENDGLNFYIQKTQFNCSQYKIPSQTTSQFLQLF